MKICIYVLDGMADWEIGYLTAEVCSKRYFSSEKKRCDIVKAGNAKDTILTMGGMEIAPDSFIEEMDLDDQDILVLPGSDNWMKEEHDTVLHIAKSRIEQDLRVAAICGATIGLARVGALNGKRHTSNDKGYLKYTAKGYTGENEYIEKPAVTDRNLITASGLAPVDFTYEILKLLGLFKSDTLEAWRNLYTEKEPKYFHRLMNSLKK